MTDPHATPDRAATVHEVIAEALGHEDGITIWDLPYMAVGRCQADYISRADAVVIALNRHSFRIEATRG